MPIKRFAHSLERDGHTEAYMSLLVNHFNPETVSKLMCRETISVGWDGQLYDCDFNQMLSLPMGGRERTIWELDATDALEGEAIEVAAHCFGCTAGSASADSSDGFWRSGKKVLTCIVRSKPTYTNVRLERLGT